MFHSTALKILGMLAQLVPPSAGNPAMIVYQFTVYEYRIWCSAPFPVTVCIIRDIYVQFCATFSSNTLKQASFTYFVLGESTISLSYQI